MIIEPKDPGTFFFDELSKDFKTAVMENDCIIYEREIPENGTPSDDFFEESEPYVCEKKEYAPRKLTLREKILFGV